MNNEERKRRICKVIVLVLGILSINNIILTIRNYSYAYFEKNIKTGVKLKITTLDEMPTKNAVFDLIKKTISYDEASQSDFNGGLVAINEDGALYNETVGNETIREYRYTGLDVNNYIYYNCKDDVEQNANNCEIWRIIGIFKDENGKEHLKIVRNNILIHDMFPSTFGANYTTYRIYANGGDYAYWNYITGTSSDKNDWATAGLQYWLNAGKNKETQSASDGYMSYLSLNAKSMIEETKYSLGTVTYLRTSNTLQGINDTPKEAYVNERDVMNCKKDTGINATESGCRVWYNNKATWIGSISLLYPSDYGYSANISYWDTSLQYGRFDTKASKNSWLQKEANHSTNEWLLSSSSDSSYQVVSWEKTGELNTGVIYMYSYGVRPTLYLKSEVKIIEGTGEETNPYQLEYNI